VPRRGDGSYSARRSRAKIAASSKTRQAQLAYTGRIESSAVGLERYTVIWVEKRTFGGGETSAVN
jgi:hypothetical protein